MARQLIGAATLSAPVRSVLLATLTLLLAAPPAHAATAVAMKGPKAQTIYGDATKLTGTVATDGTPAPGVTVQLEGRPYPYEGDFAPVETTVTAADGSFRFVRKLARNWQFRAAAAGATSARVRVYVAPWSKLTFRARSSRVIRLTQRFRVPRGVRLKQPTIFYVGPRKSKSKTIPRVASAKLTRTRAGRYTSTALVHLKPEWNGFFRYASCFRYTGGSGMGNPRAGCARRYRF